VLRVVGGLDFSENTTLGTLRANSTRRSDLPDDAVELGVHSFL
jgi:hypothetical protein